MLTLLVLLACRPDTGLTKFNSDPEAQITAPSDGTAVLAGTTLTLRGQASDPNHATTELLARWFLGDTEACASTAPAADGTTTCEVTVPAGDTMNVRLEVLDPEGAAGTAEASYPVTPNAAPVATIASPVADGVYYSDQLITFRGTVDDAEDAATALTAWWEDGDTRLEGINTSPSGSGEVLGYAQLTAGPHALELHVLDTAGNEGIATVIVDVGPPNTAPACAITRPTDGGASASGGRVDFAGTTSDVDIPASSLSVRWTSDKDGDLGTSTPDSAGSVAFSTSTLSVNTHRVTMTVTDEVGGTCASALTWTVGTPPSVTLETPLPGEVTNEGEGVTFRALVSDGEDLADALVVRWEDDLGGLLYEGAPDSTGVAQFVTNDLTPGEHVVTVTVTDTAGLTASTLRSYSVNGAPSAPTIHLTPPSPTTVDDLVVVVDIPSVDPEGDALTYTYTWLRDGVVSTASTSATLPASATTDGQTWTVEVEASDGLATSPLARASVRIANTAPTLASVTVSPDPAHRDDTVTCTPGATTDADGDTVSLTYAWTVDGIAAGTGATLTGPFVVGALVACTATPTDGKDTGASVTDSVTITNTLPVVSSVSLTPSTVYTNDTLTANAVSSDADGDTVALRYRWFVNGVELAGATASTLSGAAAGSFDRDDVVTVEVTPDDGTALGASVVSAGVTVLNTAPTTPTIAITPASPSAGDDLTCSVVTPSTDVDGDTVSYTFAWDQDGTSYAGATSGATSSTVAGADVGGGETWTCEVTAGDGSGTSATAVASATTISREAVFSYTGAAQTWIVPAGVTEINVDLAGGQGGAASTSFAPVVALLEGGRGGRVEANIPVTSGATVYIYVGGAGGTATGALCAGGDHLRGNGWNGGGYGNRCGGGGGGASDLRIGGNSLSHRVVVAGGGGGSAGGSCSVPGWTGTPGGGGGGSSGDRGYDGRCGSSDATPGGGGTQTAGGSAGSGCGGGGTAGTLGQGGDGLSGYSGGGGGGLYGGGGAGGGCDGRTTGAGGGSSLTPSGGTTTSSFQVGDGYVHISW